MRTTRLRSVGRDSTAARYVTERSWIETAVASCAGGATSSCSDNRSEADSELTLPGVEVQGADQEGGERPRHAPRHEVRARRVTAVEDLAAHREDQRHRVEVDDPPQPLGDLVVVVQDGRAVHPDAVEVRQEVGDVAEVDLRGGDQRADAGRED